MTDDIRVEELEALRDEFTTEAGELYHGDDQSPVVSSSKLAVKAGTKTVAEEGNYQVPVSPGEISVIKEQLLHLGIDPGNLDNEWDTSGQAALKVFQDMRGIKDDGIWGPDTENQLNAALGELAAAGGPPEYQKLASPGVWELQKGLRALTDATGNEMFDPGPLDGINGDITKQALMNFQGTHLTNPDEVTGTRNETTMAVLDQKLADLEEIVRAVQTDLKALSESGMPGYKAFDPGPVDGQFGPQTSEAIKAFQESEVYKRPEDSKFGPDGITGKIDLNTIAAIRRNVEEIRPPIENALDSLEKTREQQAIQRFFDEAPPPSASPEPDNAPRPQQNRNENQSVIDDLEKIKMVQNKLSRLAERTGNEAFDPGPEDGIPGPRTTDAVQEFQKQYPEEFPIAHGNITQRTIEVLDRQLARVDNANELAEARQAAAEPDQAVPDQQSLSAGFVNIGMKVTQPDQPAATEERMLEASDVEDPIYDPNIVKDVESKLADLARETGNAKLNPVSVDGLADADTEKAVQALQEQDPDRFRLPHGMITPNTLTLLDEKLAEAKANAPAVDKSGNDQVEAAVTRYDGPSQDV